MGGSKQAWARAEQVAAGQRRLVTRRQCLQAGLGRSSIAHALAPPGRWQRVLPGVYACFTGPLTVTHLIAAALLFGGPSAQVTGLTALALYGCQYLPNDPRVHLLLPASVHRTSPGFLRIHRTHTLPHPHWRQGFPVTPTDRAAILATAHLTSLRDVRALLSEVVQRQLTTVERLDAALALAASAGSALPRRALADLAAGCRSAPEMELRDLVRRRPHLFRAACWNHRVQLGSTWFVADVCWPYARLIVEVDSVEHHGLGEGPERTARRRAALVAAGWIVLSVSPRRIREQPDAVLAEIEAVVRRAAA
jgi:very-short-patch-repair endonuclease